MSVWAPMKKILMPVSVAKKRSLGKNIILNPAYICIGIHHCQSLETVECLTPVEKEYCLNMDILERDLYQVALILKTG